MGLLRFILFGYIRKYIQSKSDYSKVLNKNSNTFLFKSSAKINAIFFGLSFLIKRKILAKDATK